MVNYFPTADSQFAGITGSSEIIVLQIPQSQEGSQCGELHIKTFAITMNIQITSNGPTTQTYTASRVGYRIVSLGMSSIFINTYFNRYEYPPDAIKLILSKGTCTTRTLGAAYTVIADRYVRRQCSSILLMIIIFTTKSATMLGPELRTTPKVW